MNTKKLIIQPDRFMKDTRVIELNLYQKGDSSIIDDYYAKVDNKQYVRNDYYYSILVFFDGVVQNIDSCYINNEYTNKFKSHNKLFNDCFGISKIEVIINGISYITNNLPVWINQYNDNTNILNMIDYIYDNCDDYLYEEHRHSKISSGIMYDSHISLDSKLALLNDIYDAYIRCYLSFLNSPYSKLINDEKVKSFSELQTINLNTIKYIACHPEELHAVNYNSGISINKQYYEPNQTLVETTSYSCDVYENQVIVGFISTVVTELQNIIQELEILKKKCLISKPSDGYVESSFFIYTKNLKIINEYINLIIPQIKKFEKLYYMYKLILPVRVIAVTYQPRYTNTFCNLMPYKILFNNITNWFKCGKYNIEKSELLLSFVSLSKIYEYYCLIKINRAIEANNFVKTNGFAHKYIETKYYSNTTYHNTFEFKKGDKTITVYYQPVIYGRSIKRGDNKIGLFRNTSVSISELSINTLFDDTESWKADYYTPDYVIKIETNNKIHNFIIDAKHTTINNVEKFQLPSLVYKYLFSISPMSDENMIAGLCILCGKEDSGDHYNSVHDIADYINIILQPETYLVSLSGKNVDINDNFNEFIKKLIDTPSKMSKNS